MTPTYEKIHHGICTINFAYKQDDIIVYPDLIKVKISLDNGQMVGFECKNYLISHRAREIEEPTLSLDEARALLSSDFEVESERLAIILHRVGKRDYAMNLMENLVKISL